jgi:hypothetical protein
MKINVKTKANINKKHPELCSWSCPYVNAYLDSGSKIDCILFNKCLNWITLSGGREMPKRCKQCLANVIGGSSGLRNRKRQVRG